MKTSRIVIAALSLSAAAFVGIVTNEGYTDTAIIPTKNDVPTLGHGSTVYEDGTRVKMGDKITPTRALILATNHLSREESAFRASLPNVLLYQGEYDLYMDWVYQYGTGRWQKSSMRQHLVDGNYRAACDALLAYKYSGGYDCSIAGNRVCAGVWKRQQDRHKKCVAMQ